MLEAAKGALVLLVGFGSLSLIHQDIQRFAERLIAHAHLNPAATYPHIFLDIAREATDSRLFLLAIGAAVYASVRFVEAYGLWLGRRWAKFLGAFSGGIYIPFEMLELYERVTWISAGALVLNLAIVLFITYSLQSRRSEFPDAA